MKSNAVTEDEFFKIIEMKSFGKSNDEIAELIERHPKTISRILKNKKVYEEKFNNQKSNGADIESKYDKETLLFMKEWDEAIKRIKK